MRYQLSLFGLLCLILGATASTAQPPGDAVTPPCRGAVWWAKSPATFQDFDFWVGEWQVYDRSSGDLLGFDQIEKAFGGCTLRQHWRQMNDRFVPPGASRRYQGGSFSALAANGRWRQNWLDSSGGNILLEGALDANGAMVLESDWLAFTSRQGQPVRLKYRWHWDRQEDGTILNWGFMKQIVGEGPEPEWQQYFDIVYRRNAPGGPSSRLINGADQAN